MASSGGMGALRDGGGWKNDGKAIRNEGQFAQHLCEENFGRKQIPGLGKGQVGSESTLRTRHL